VHAQAPEFPDLSSLRVVALVQIPTSIPAARNAPTMAMNSGWIVGSPPVTVTRRTRQPPRRGITVLITSASGIC
jgi:hypothetical protein